MANLVTLAQVKDYLGLTGSAEADDALNTLITTSTAVIRRHIDPIEYVEYADESYDGDGGQVIMLRHWPLKVDDDDRTVKLDGIDITSSCTFDARLGRLYRSAGFSSGFQNVAVTYTAGYGESVPDDLVGACLMLVKFYFNSDLTARSVFLQGGGGLGMERAMPMQVRSILESYPSYRF